jgi:tetratricopeptide (TPR) repeat protein
MKIFALLLSLMFPLPMAQNNYSVSGSIRDFSGRSVDSIRVSLLDDNYQTVKTVFSYGGRYQFKGLRPGAYFVKVETLGTVYEEEISQRIEVQSMRRRAGGSEEFYYDFVLKLKKGEKIEGSSRVVFAQAVPEAARFEYERGTKSLEDGNAELAVDSFKKAVELFRDYFAALEALGIEYVKRGEFLGAIPVLTHALAVNHSAPKSLYALGVAHLKLDQLDEAVKWLEKSADQDSQSINVHMMLGIAYGNKRQLDKSEASFRKAYEIGRDRAAEAHLYLAGLYNKQEKYPDAVRELELYLKEAKDIDQAKIKGMIDNLKAKEKSKP